MKVCCDRCEKAMKKNLFGELEASCKITIIHKFFFDETIYLCNECLGDLRGFLKEKGDAK